MQESPKRLVRVQIGSPCHSNGIAIPPPSVAQRFRGNTWLGRLHDERARTNQFHQLFFQGPIGLALTTPWYPRTHGHPNPG